jgi:osmotically inducible protein OsmC
VPVRDASTQWQGDLQTGSGVVTLDSSNAGQFPVTFPRRAGEPEGYTSPEELIAAAHSACFAMSLSNGLSTAGTPPTSLAVSVEVELGRNDTGLAITSIRLSVDGTVPGITAEAFAAAADVAKAGCIVSRALAGVEDITVTATLL